MTTDDLLTREFLSTVEGYVNNFMRHHFWRVDKTLDRDDVVQEAYLQLIRTVRRMDKNNFAIESEKHLMALFKTSWSRYFTDLTNKNSKHIPLEDQIFMEDDGQQFSTLDLVVGDDGSEGFMAYALDQAPDDIATLITFLANAPSETLELIKGRDNPAFIAALIGVDPSTNILQRTKDFISDCL